MKRIAGYDDVFVAFAAFHAQRATCDPFGADLVFCFAMATKKLHRAGAWIGLKDVFRGAHGVKDRGCLANAS